MVLALEVEDGTLHHVVEPYSCISHKSLVNISHQLARWGLILHDMDLEIKYRPSKKNSNTDTLFRYHIEAPIVQDATTKS